MHDELARHFKLRVITSVQQVRSLRDFDGPIILWTRWVDHSFRFTLRQIGVKFTPFSGSLSALISYIRTEFKS